MALVPEMDIWLRESMEALWRRRNAHLAKDQRRLRLGRLSLTSSACSENTMHRYALGLTSRNFEEHSAVIDVLLRGLGQLRILCMMVVTKCTMDSDESRCGGVSVRWNTRLKTY